MTPVASGLRRLYDGVQSDEARMVAKGPALFHPGTMARDERSGGRCRRAPVDDQGDVWLRGKTKDDVNRVRKEKGKGEEPKGGGTTHWCRQKGPRYGSTRRSSDELLRRPGGVNRRGGRGGAGVLIDADGGGDHGLNGPIDDLDRRPGVAVDARVNWGRTR